MTNKKFTKKDEAHYLVFKYLDILGISEPYLHATAILEDIKDYLKHK